MFSIVAKKHRGSRGGVRARAAKVAKAAAEAAKAAAAKAAAEAAAQTPTRRRGGNRGGAGARADKAAAQARREAPVCTHCRNLNENRGPGQQLNTAHWVRVGTDRNSSSACPVLAQTRCTHCMSLGHTKSMCLLRDKPARDPARPAFLTPDRSAAVCPPCAPDAPRKICFRIANWADDSDSDDDLEAFVPAAFLA